MVLSFISLETTRFEVNIDNQPDFPLETDMHKPDPNTTSIAVQARYFFAGTFSRLLMSLVIFAAILVVVVHPLRDWLLNQLGAAFTGVLSLILPLVIIVMVLRRAGGHKPRSGGGNRH